MRRVILALSIVVAISIWHGQPCGGEGEEGGRRWSMLSSFTTTRKQQPKLASPPPPDRPCLYTLVMACLQDQNQFHHDNANVTLRAQHNAMDECVQQWLETNVTDTTNNNTSNTTSKSKSTWRNYAATTNEMANDKTAWIRSVEPRGSLNDRLAWSLWRLGATDAAAQNWQQQACGNNNDNMPWVPSWGNTTRSMAHTLYNQGGVYLPPWYTMEEQEPAILPGGFVLPRGPVRRIVSKFNLQPGFFHLHMYTRETNLGDCYNHYILAALQGRNYSQSSSVVPQKQQQQQQQQHPTTTVCMVGSVLGPECEVIWGTGLMFEDRPKELKNPQAEIYATRGPHTLDLLVNGMPARPRVAFGDPGLLLPLLLPLPRTTQRQEQEQQYAQVCVIPHYIDQSTPAIKQVQLQLGNQTQGFIDGLSVRILNIQTCDVRGFAEHLSACRTVLSSTLHGLIFSLAYGIPGMRLVLSQKVAGGHFKFRDFYQGIGRPDLYRFEVVKGNHPIPFRRLYDILRQTTVPPIDVEDLWNANPVHAENVGMPRQDHLSNVRSYFANLDTFLPHEPYTDLVAS